MWWEALLGVGLGLLLVWGLLVLVLWRLAPDATTVAEALRLLPDVVRLVARLARDGSLPRGVRVRLWLLAAYFAFPLDLVPDVIPVVGYADDAVVVAVVLRSVVRRAGVEPLRRHWPGTPDGLAALERLVAPRGQRGPRTGPSS